jgi:hypothetical protein
MFVIGALAVVQLAQKRFKTVWQLQTHQLTKRVKSFTNWIVALSRQNEIQQNDS